MSTKKKAAKFTDPIFHVHVFGEHSSYVLRNLSHEDFCGIPCISGVFAKQEVSWLFGQKVRIPIEKVSIIVEYKSMDDYLKKLKSFQRKRITDVGK